jgi:hypothetical protein
MSEQTTVTMTMSLEAAMKMAGVSDEDAAELQRKADDLQAKLLDLIERAKAHADRITQPIVDSMAAFGVGADHPDVAFVIVDMRRRVVSEWLKPAGYVLTDDGRVVKAPA